MRISEHYWWVPLVVIFGSIALIVTWLFYKRQVIWGIILGMVGFLLLAIALPSARPAWPQAQINACVANAKLLNGAVEQWAAANGKQVGDKIDYYALTNYVKGKIMPKCPRGGYYVFETVGKMPTCSLPEHANAVQQQ